MSQTHHPACTLRQGVKRPAGRGSLGSCADGDAAGVRQKNGYIVAREYNGEAESGRIADRPLFRRMSEERGCQNVPFEVILV